MSDFIVVGAGFSGAVAAERLASAGCRVLVIDKRAHIAGNAFDELDVQGALIHRYRSLRFEHEHLDGVLRYQETGTVNYPNDHAFTRITEFKHLKGQVHPGTSIVKEHPEAVGEPYYPIPSDDNEALFKRYETLAKSESGVTFVGRLAQYRYYNMDQVVGDALSAAKTLLA